MAYTKQTWNDLPNTTTPITAEKLNHMEDGIYDAHNLVQDAITIGLSTQATQTGVLSAAIPFDTQISKIGTKLSFDSTKHCIVVGSGVNYIEVSGKILQEGSSANLYGFLIVKNASTIVSANYFYIQTANQMFSQSSPPLIISVTEGDEIYLRGYNNNTTITSTYRAYPKTGNYMTAKVMG